MFFQKYFAKLDIVKYCKPMNVLEAPLEHGYSENWLFNELIQKAKMEMH